MPFYITTPIYYVNAEPLVASRSERAILADVEAALAEAAGIPRQRRGSAGKGQESLL